MYLSEIDLNRDFGLLPEPHIPTLRAVTQIPDESGNVFALAVINVDLRPLFAELQALVGSHTQLLLASTSGEYLLHPDSSRTFASDAGTDFNFFRDFPEAAKVGLDPAWLRAANEDELLLCRRQPLTAKTAREVMIAVLLPADELLAGVRQTRTRALKATALVAVVAIGLLTLAARPAARRLRRVTEAIARYDAGAPVDLPDPGGDDEVGVLATKFVEMADKVRAQVRSLDAARREAEEATRAKEDFLAVMSHEIRTPMNAVLGLLRVLERNKPAPHQEPVLKSLRVAANNLMSLLNQALDFTKLRAGHIDFERTDFPLAQMLSDLAVMHGPTALQKGLELKLDLSPDLPAMVHGDAVRLGQILNNLLGNALKFTDHGSISLAATPLDARRIQFVVEDTGIGISSENIDRVFQPFMQATGLDARKTDGTGLGLSITRALVELQQGSIEVSSTPGQGSRFVVRLPFEPATSAAGAAGEEEIVPQFAGCRLLYVEDVASNRDVMAATLDGTGAILSFAENGVEALARLRTTTYDLAMLDVQLPDTTGPELARNIRAQGFDLPLIAVTAQTSPAVIEACIAAGMAGVVTKPLDPRRLFDELSRQLKREPAPVSLKTLREIFAERPEHLGPMLESLSSEFRNYHRELERAFANDDLAAVRRVRHQAHSAIEYLDLAELRSVWARVIEGEREPRSTLPRASRRQASDALATNAAVS